MAGESSSPVPLAGMTQVFVGFTAGLSTVVVARAVLARPARKKQMEEWNFIARDTVSKQIEVVTALDLVYTSIARLHIQVKKISEDT